MRFTNPFALAVFILLACALSSHGQQFEADQARVWLLEDKIARLESRLKEMEARMGAVPAAKPIGIAASPIPVADLALTAIPAPVEAPAVDGDGSHRGGPSFSVRGFTNLDLSAIKEAGGTASFGLGQLDLFVTSRLSNHFGFLAEIVIEGSPRNEIAVELERMLFQFRASEYFKVDVGRYHTSIGYYNTAYHHGKWFETAADRPMLFNFEDHGGILPMHNVGVSISGRVPSGRANLGYILEIGNGQADHFAGEERVQNVTDRNRGKSLNIGLRARPGMLPGLELGTSVYSDSFKAANAIPIRQHIVSAHAVYIRGRVETLNEFVWMRHQQRPFSGDRVDTVMPAFYSQWAYRVKSTWRPFFRYEFMNPAAADPVLQPILGTAGWRRAAVGGVRWDFSELAALKLQLQRVTRHSDNAAYQASLQLAFTF